MLSKWTNTYETIKLFSILFFLIFAYAYVNNQEYHEMFDKVSPIKYNCDMLIGGWHPDVPVQVINECRHQYLNKRQEKI
jgi:hypothetical protein